MKISGMRVGLKLMSTGASTANTTTSILGTVKTNT